MMTEEHNPELARLIEDDERKVNWKRWGPYLPERQWGTVREDYSEDGNCWDYFSHEHARSRAYRWGDDGLLGFTDRQCRICLSVALWNERDPFLKERLYGLTNHQGNHGEDVKELYYYLRGTPTHSYMKALYKYPQRRFPYEELIEESQRRGRRETEYELSDTGLLDRGEYFDVEVEFAKAGPEDVLIQYTIHNRAKQGATLHLLPQVWFRNTWSWQGKHLTGNKRPHLTQVAPGVVRLERETLGTYHWQVDTDGSESNKAADFQRLLFTENATNYEKLFQAKNQEPCVKDAFHDYVVWKKKTAIATAPQGTKAAAYFLISLPPGGSRTVRVRFTGGVERPLTPFSDFDEIMTARAQECDQFYAAKLPASLTEDDREICLQSYAGLLWSKQFYYYPIAQWLPGDKGRPFSAEVVAQRRNANWPHVFARDVISMPDKWEYPWFAAWDLAFHCVALARVDASFAKQQLTLLLREWYMHPNGQIPAYEFAFSDVNPPVHAWAAWQVYLIDAEATGKKDRDFLSGMFQKLLLNFTWWVNRKDEKGQGVFSGGFLGLDNIGIFDRGAPLPTGGYLQQADATAWMAFFCCAMLRISLELSYDGRLYPAYQDMASKFLLHFVQIVEAVHTHGGTGLWDEYDGFYYDHIQTPSGRTIALKSRSLVGLLPLIAVEVLDEERLALLPEFRERFRWHLENTPLLSKHLVLKQPKEGSSRWLLALTSRDRLRRVLRYLLDEQEFLSTYGIRSLSRYHLEHPFRMEVAGQTYEVKYTPGESTTQMFGGNSNWRGPVWFPINFLLIQALERYHDFYGTHLMIEYPTGSGQALTLQEVADELKKRHAKLFRLAPDGSRPCHGPTGLYRQEGRDRSLILFYEFFHGDHGSGHGASHQTGWTALVAAQIEALAAKVQK
jgi:hypothetical protein